MADDLGKLVRLGIRLVWFLAKVYIVLHFAIKYW